METNARINAALKAAIDSSAGPPCPPRLVEAINYAVFPGGHRIRPACVTPSPRRTKTATGRLSMRR